MATLSLSKVTEDGVEPTLASAAAGGDEWAWADNAFVYIDNADASSHTITITSHATDRPGVDVTDLAVAVPAGESRFIGPIDGAYRNRSNGTVSMSYDAVTSVTVGVFRL